MRSGNHGVSAEEGPPEAPRLRVEVLYGSLLDVAVHVYGENSVHRRAGRAVQKQTAETLYRRGILVGVQIPVGKTYISDVGRR